MRFPQVPDQRLTRRYAADLLRSARRLGRYYLRTPSILAFALMAWVLVAMGVVDKGTHFAGAMATILVLVEFLVISAAPAASDSGHLPPDAQSDSVDTTPWRLYDPGFSHWGLWRADLGRLPPEVESFHDRALVKKYIQKLLDDWTQRSARGGRAIRIFGELTRSRGPFDDDPPGCRVYQITLKDEDKTRRTGWLRLGPGWVEFQLERNRRDRDWYREISFQAETIGSARVAPRPISFEADPMWDRWLDG